MPASAMTTLLKDVLVIESSMLLNGASTAMMLADLGARVIKIESPFLGDYIRAADTAHLHRQVNRNKRSLALDLRKEEGRDVLARLIRKADVFVTNAVGERNASLGLDYQSLRQLKPDLIYCQNTGYGATGPYRDIPTHGQMMDALAGAMPVQMDHDGLVGPDPSLSRRTGTLASGGEGTAAGAIYSAFHIAAALHHRDATGAGCYIDTSSAAAVVSSAWVAASAMLNVPGRRGWWQNEDNTRPVARYQSYQTADGRFLLFCPEERKFWHRFCEVVDRPELKSEHRGLDLRRKIQEIIGSRSLDDWMTLAVEHRLPMGPINNDVDAVRADPQIESRGLFVEVAGEGGNPFTVLRQPSWVDGQASVVGSSPPELGEHSDEILAELGYDASEIAALRNRGITGASEIDREHISRALFGEQK